MKINIRPYQARDADVLTELFYNTIHAVGIEHYTKAQVDAWAPLPIDYSKWHQRFEACPPWVAVIDDNIAGFITLADDGYIDLAYTDSRYQRRGVATALYKHIEALAIAQEIKKLTVNASYFAKPLFVKHGFVVLTKNDNIRNGEVLVNFTMAKAL